MYSESINLLHHLILPGNVGDAVSLLNRLDWLIDLHKVYQHFFPEEYALDRCEWMADDLINGIVSRWELNLFGLVDSNLFSLPETMVNGEEIFQMIPVWPMYPEWWDSDIDDLPKSFQILLCLSNNIDSECFSHSPSWLDIISDQQEGAELDEQKLKILCEQAEYPLSVLPKVVEILNKSTENAWLDSSNEYYPEFDWTIEQIEILRSHWLECQSNCSQIGDLDDWLENDENAVIAINLFHKACENYVQVPDNPQSLLTVLDTFLKDE